jgi:uncharacterized protein YicC (UPF0701 family)
VDVFVTIDRSGAEKVSVTVNKPAADGYYAALCTLRDSYHLSDDPTIAVMARFPDLLTVEKTPEDLESVASDICQVLDLALADFTKMREREGSKLAEDVLNRSETIRTLLAAVEERSPKSVAEYRQRLEARMAEVLQNKQIDESRFNRSGAFRGQGGGGRRDGKTAQPSKPTERYDGDRRPGGPEAGFSHPGVQPGSQHHRLQMQRYRTYPSGPGPEVGD